MRTLCRATLLGLAVAGLLVQAALADPTPLDTSHAGGASTPAPAARVDSVKPEPTDRSQSGLALGDRMTVDVANLQNWKDHAKCDQAVLYLDGLPIEGLRPQCNQAKGTLAFHLVRGDATTAAGWCAALGCSSATKRDVSVTVGIKGSDPLDADADVPKVTFRIYSPTWPACLPAAALLLFILITFRGGLLRDSVPDVKQVKDRPYSLSRCQMAGWLVLIVGTFCLVWISTGEIPAISQQLLAMLGIAMGTTVGGAAINSSQSDRRGSAVNALAAQANPARPFTVAATANGVTPIVVAPPPGTQPPAAVLVVPQHRNFLFDILAENGAISVSRLQYAVWTIVLWVLFAITVFRCFGVLDFDKTLLGLMGISSLAYGANKTTESAKT
jgi:hypothetical protein